MTTSARIDEVLARFERRSPCDAYKIVCKDLNVHPQQTIYSMLPDAACAFHRINTLEVEKCLLGTKGCMALLPIITVSTTLRKISLRSCGVSDEFVKALCEILQTHPSVRAVDVGDNELVTVYSAPSIISLMKSNSNMVTFDVDGTHVGRNVGNIIAALGQRNAERVIMYYQDNYFKMKDLFNYLDENGSGWVFLKSLVLNCPYPVLQEQFIERIALKKPKKRSDNTININTFLQLVYMNYKDEVEIAKYAAGTQRKSIQEEPGGDCTSTNSNSNSNISLDEPYLLIAANWKQVLRAVERHNEAAAKLLTTASEKSPRQSNGIISFHNEEESQPLHLTLPEDFHRLRLRDFLLTNDEADSLVSEAVLLEMQRSSDDSSATPNAKMTELQLSVWSLIRSSKSSFIPPPSTKPVYQFYQERDAAYIPNCLRNGSRLFSVGRMSILNESFCTVNSARPDVVDLPTDPQRTFSLPASLVKMMVNFFNCECAKLSRGSRRSNVVDTPRTRRNKAMERAAIPIRTFLSAEFITEYEKLLPRLLGDYYARYSLPIDDCTITMQEMINLMDEMYTVCRVDRLWSLEAVMDMPDPMVRINEERKLQPAYMEFFNKYWREENNDEVELWNMN